MFLLSLYAVATNMSYYNARLYRTAEEEPQRAEGEAGMRGETVISSLVVRGSFQRYLPL
jgi:hypothetical protein